MTEWALGPFIGAQQTTEVALVPDLPVVLVIVAVWLRLRALKPLRQLLEYLSAPLPGCVPLVLLGQFLPPGPAAASLNLAAFPWSATAMLKALLVRELH